MAHNDLLTYIFTTLSTSSVIPFKEQIQKWHRQYFEAEMTDLTPSKLINTKDLVQLIVAHISILAQ
jgi:hypothetical protein